MITFHFSDLIESSSTISSLSLLSITASSVGQQLLWSWEFLTRLEQSLIFSNRSLNYFRVVIQSNKWMSHILWLLFSSMRLFWALFTLLKSPFRIKKLGVSIVRILNYARLVSILILLVLEQLSSKIGHFWIIRYHMIVYLRWVLVLKIILNNILLYLGANIKDIVLLLQDVLETRVKNQLLLSLDLLRVIFFITRIFWPMLARFLSFHGYFLMGID